MKRIIYFFAISCLFASCNMGQTDKSKELIDSLKNANSMLKNGYDDLISNINDINAGFSQIVAAEDRINSISINQDGETTSAAPTQNIKENMEFIIQIIDDNKNKIKALEDKLADKTYASEELMKLVQSMKSQLSDKQKEIADLKQQLQEKNIQIGKLGVRIDELKTENDNVIKENQAVKSENQSVKEENRTIREQSQAVIAENEVIRNENEQVKKDNEAKERILQNQDAQINEAFYVIGTKKELKKKNILSSGEILTKDNYDRNAFTKIDIRNTTTIPLYSKYMKLLSKHPASSYTSMKDSKGDYTLKITNPSEFWSLTKYLVIRIKD